MGAEFFRLHSVFPFSVMNAKSNNARLGILLVGLGICFGLGFAIGKKSVPPVQPAPAVAAQISVVTNIVTVIQKDPAAENNPSSPSANWSKSQWDQLLSQLATPDRNAKLAALMEQFAMADPTNAMALAQGQSNLMLRKELVQAALHGWARKAPLDAATWVMAMPNSGARDTALSTVFSGAIATDPDAAVAMGQTLLQQYPGDAISCGSRLVDALCDSGNFNAAATLAEGGSSDQRTAWLSESFSKWASFQPDAAAQAAQAIGDPQTRSQALHGIVGGWAESDPAGLVQFLGQLPAGDDRAQMLGQALKSWVQNDPVAAANWMNNNNGSFGSDIDQGAAQVATVESMPTDLALSWAENIGDPQLRSSTVSSVVRDWLYNDRAAAENYVQTTTNLSAADRQQLSEVMADMARASSTQ